MTKILRFILIVCLIIFLPLKIINSKVIENTVFEKIKTNWDYFVEAIIEVESNGNDSVINEHNYGGCLQIGKIYVKEVNRISSISGGEIYSLDDRLNREKSLEMFAIIQKFYNPEKNFVKALKYHNPTAKNSYLKKILQKYIEIKKQAQLGERIVVYVPP